MTNNDVLRRLRYALNLSDGKVVELFGLAGYELGGEELDLLYLKEGEEGFVECEDALVGFFLQGLIADRRGKRENGAEGRAPSLRLSNNDILKQLRIALELRDDDVIDIMARAGVRVSKSEVGALFRKKSQPNFRPCGDQFLRNFLSGLTARLRGGSPVQAP